MTALPNHQAHAVYQPAEPTTGAAPFLSQKASTNGGASDAGAPVMANATDTERRAVSFVSVVMPCLDEEKTVAPCVRAALRGIRAVGLSGEVVVCDNGSTDNSTSLAAVAGARVVRCAQRGYGNAVRRAVEESLGHWIVMGDADGSYDFTHLAPFVERLSAGTDLVIGNRFRGGIAPGAMPLKNRYLGNPALTSVLNLLFGTGVGDSQCGLRAFSREAFERMELECEGMALATEMLVNASLRGLVVEEVPVALAKDGRGGRPPHLSPWRDGLRILSLLVRSRFAVGWSAGRAPERTLRPAAASEASGIRRRVSGA